jgi:phage baseplate assembly protein W
MAINRKTRQYSDLNLLFTAHPTTADITKKVDEEAVKASIRNLISTRNYERPFHPEIGCQVFSLLFENFNPITIQVMKNTIRDVIQKYEPRVKLLDVNIRDLSDNNEIQVEVFFKLINSEKPITLTSVISRVR